MAWLIAPAKTLGIGPQRFDPTVVRKDPEHPGGQSGRRTLIQETGMIRETGIVAGCGGVLAVPGSQQDVTGIQQPAVQHQDRHVRPSVAVAIRRDAQIVPLHGHPQVPRRAEVPRADDIE